MPTGDPINLAFQTDLNNFYNNIIKGLEKPVATNRELCGQALADIRATMNEPGVIEPILSTDDPLFGPLDFPLEILTSRGPVHFLTADDYLNWQREQPVIQLGPDPQVEFATPKPELIQKAISGLTADQQQQLYIWMHETLNCRIYK